jgi:hypothetical protein
VEDYLNDIKVTSWKSIHSVELYAREEVMKELKAIMLLKGSLVCILGGTNSGKSFAFHYLKNEFPTSVLLVDSQVTGPDILIGIDSAFRNIVHGKRNAIQEKIKGYFWAIVSSLTFGVSREIPQSNKAEVGIQIRDSVDPKERQKELVRVMQSLVQNGITTLIVDEANIAFPHVSSAKSDLEYFTTLTKQGQKVPFPIRFFCFLIWFEFISVDECDSSFLGSPFPV